MGVQRKMRFGCIGRALYHSSQSFSRKGHPERGVFFVAETESQADHAKQGSFVIDEQIKVAEF